MAERNKDKLNRGFIYHIKHGCPLCKGDIKGNDFVKYFCPKCNVLFDRKDILPLEEREQEEKSENEKTEQKKSEVLEKNKTNKTKIEEPSEEKEIQETNILDEENKEEKEIEAEVLKQKESEKPSGLSLSHSDIMNALGESKSSAEEIEQEESEEIKETDETVEEGNEDVDETQPEIEEKIERKTKKKTKKEEQEYDLESDEKLIASSESKKIHAGNCHFVSKIQPENRIYFGTVEEGESKGFELCVCLRRRKAMARNRR